MNKLDAISFDGGHAAGASALLDVGNYYHSSAAALVRRQLGEPESWANAPATPPSSTRSATPARSPASSWSPTASPSTSDDGCASSDRAASLRDRPDDPGRRPRPGTMPATRPRASCPAAPREPGESPRPTAPSAPPSPAAEDWKNNFTRVSLVPPQLRPAPRTARAPRTASQRRPADPRHLRHRIQRDVSRRGRANPGQRRQGRAAASASRPATPRRCARPCPRSRRPSTPGRPRSASRPSPPSSRRPVTRSSCPASTRPRGRSGRGTCSASSSTRSS